MPYMVGLLVFVRITYDAFSASKIHRSDPRSTDSEKTWVSNSSIPTYWTGSVGTSKVPCNFLMKSIISSTKTNSHMYVPYCEQHPRFTKKRLGVLLPTASVIDPLVRQWKIGKGRYVIRLPWRPLKSLVCILLSCLAARLRLNKLVRVGSKSSNSKITNTTN